MKLVYEDKFIKLFNGDAFEANFEFDICFTDPPFGLCLNGLENVLLNGNTQSFIMSNERVLVEFSYKNIDNFSRFFAVDTVIPNMISAKAPMNKCDFIAEFRVGKTKFVNNNEAFSTFIRAAKVRQKKHYSNNFDKSETIPAYFIKHYSEVGDTIFDPFCGYGSTLTAAKKLGRKAIGVEKDASVCDKLVRKLSQKDLFTDAN